MLPSSSAAAAARLALPRAAHRGRSLASAALLPAVATASASAHRRPPPASHPPSSRRHHVLLRGRHPSCSLVPTAGAAAAAAAVPLNETSGVPVRSFRNKVSGGGASSGRIAWWDGKRKEGAAGAPKLCSGCGVEIVSGGRGEDAYGHGGRDGNGKQGGRMASGGDVSEDGRTKRQRKMARFASVEDSRSNSSLCRRCKSLQGGDVWAAYDALKDVDSKVFSAQLAHIVGRRQFGLCVVVVDATDPEFTAVKKLRDIIRGVPCILAVNKADLLPRKMNRHDLGYIRERVEKGRAKMIGSYAVSAKNGTGVVDLAEGILKRLMGREVFVVGAANVGKSSLVKTLSDLLARTIRMRGRNKYSDDKRRETLMNLKVTASHLPGTTLQAVRIPCFPSVRHALWDTPGVINRSALAYSLFPSHLMEPLAFPHPILMPREEDGTKFRVTVGNSILIEARWMDAEMMPPMRARGGSAGDDIFEDDSEDGDGDVPAAPFTLARIDVVEDSGFPLEAVAYVPSCLRVRVAPTRLAPEVAAMPTKYVERIRNLVGRSRGNFAQDGEEAVTRPLSIFKGYTDDYIKDGALSFGPVRDADAKGWIRRDVVLAGLGWINFNHRSLFSVRPWVVQGSLWAKRRALYPSNLGDHSDGYDEMDGAAGWGMDAKSTDFRNMKDGDEDFELIKRRLQDAVETGRQRADLEGRRKRFIAKRERGGRGAPAYAGEHDDDEWWSA